MSANASSGRPAISPIPTLKAFELVQLHPRHQIDFLDDPSKISIVLSGDPLSLTTASKIHMAIETIWHSIRRSCRIFYGFFCRFEPLLDMGVTNSPCPYCNDRRYEESCLSIRFRTRMRIKNHVRARFSEAHGDFSRLAISSRRALSSENSGVGSLMGLLRRLRNSSGQSIGIGRF